MSKAIYHIYHCYYPLNKNFLKFYTVGCRRLETLLWTLSDLEFFLALEHKSQGMPTLEGQVKKRSRQRTGGKNDQGRGR